MAAAQNQQVQEAIPRPVQRKFPIVSVLLGLSAIALLGTALVERDPLMKLVRLRAASRLEAPQGGRPE